MISKKNYLLFGISFFSIFSFAQTIDSVLLSQLSSEEISIAQEVLETENILDSEDQELLSIEETLEENRKITDEIYSKKFGYDFFSAMPTSLSAVGDLPLPNDYKISLKDQFKVILSGSRDQIFNLNVNLDGTILFPELGSIYVAGLTFEEVKEKLSNMINQSYIGVNIDISLQNLSAKKITIVGAVKTPGTYLVNPFSTITGALAYSGGISEIGSLRDIKLIRNDGTIFSFDLYDLLIKGDRSNDLTIEAGDTILINAASQFIEIKGAVNRPSIYEILEGEEIIDIVDFALGFTLTANKSNISISYLDLESASVITKNKVSLNQKLENALIVNVFDYLSENNLSIRVSGAVVEPGFYDLEEYVYLSDLIEDLRFIDVYPWLAVLEQFDDKNLVKSTILFNLNDKSSYESIELLPNSSLYFANIDDRSFDVSETARDLIDSFSLEINLKESKYKLPVFGKFYVKSFVDLLGLDLSDLNPNATYISPIDNIIVTADYKEMQFIAKKYNTISFRSPVNDLISVTISGAVSYPGTYTLKSDSMLSNLYELVGDFKDEAFFDGVILKRESVRKRQLEAIERSQNALKKALLLNADIESDVNNIALLSSIAESIEPEDLGRVAGDFSPISSIASETKLFDGDEIFIPKVSNVINVIGEVLNPTAYEFSKKISIEKAIDKAGGFNEFADRKRVYVIKANGLIEKTGRNVFIRSSNLMPGDTVVVPRKTSTNALKNLTPITQILSDLAFSAAAIDNLSNN